MATCSVAEHYRWTERAAAAAVDHRGHRSHRVSGCVQAGNRIAAGAEHASIDVRPGAALGTERAAADLHRVERWLRDRADARRRRVEVSLIAVPAVVRVVAAPEIVVVAAATSSFQRETVLSSACGSMPVLLASSDGVEAEVTQSGTSSPGAAVTNPNLRRWA